MRTLNLPDFPELHGQPIPNRHTLFSVGPLAFYWIWINEGTEHQHRCWIVNWRSKNRLIHLSHWQWWTPIRQFPAAMRLSLRTSRKS